MCNVNPFVLFLILILLILSTQPNCVRQIEKVTNMLSAIKESAVQLRSEMVKIQSVLQ